MLFRKYRNYGLLCILFIVFSLSVYNSRIYITIISVLITLWVFGFIPIAIIQRRKDDLRQKRVDNFLKQYDDKNK